MVESLKTKIRNIARRLAEEELHKRSKGGIVAFGEARHRVRHHKGRGEALLDNYGLEVVEGGKRRVGRPRKHHGMGEGEGEGEMMMHRVHHRSRSMSRGRAEGERMHRVHHRAGLIAYGEGEGEGERMMRHHRSMSRGRALIDTYGLEVEGGRRTYHKVGKEYVKRTRKPSAYNMFVKEYILKHRGAKIADAAAAWRARK